MSVVLFISASSFTQYLVDSVTTTMSPPDYDLVYMVDDNQLMGKTPEALSQLFKSDEYVTKVTYAKDRAVFGKVAEKYFTDQLLKIYGEEMHSGYADMQCTIYFADDAEFKKILKDNNLKEEDFYNPQSPVAIAQDTGTFFDYSKQKYITLDMLKGDGCEVQMTDFRPMEGYYVFEVFEEDGKKWVDYRNESDFEDSIKIPYESCATEYTLKSVKTIEDAPLFVNTSNPSLNLIYPLSMIDKVLPQGERALFDSYAFYLESDNHAATFENIQKSLSQNGLPTQNFYDIAAESEMNRNLITIIQVFAYGFVILISLISVANVFNTISTNISLRRREFAMLKSVGMTQKGFNKMMNFECLIYGLKALITGLPVSFIVTYIIYCVITQGYSAAFYLPLKAVAIAVISVFLVVFVTMMYAMRKIKKDNPIDALKNENL